jgi:putative Mg2+ transporter-C (MgtC) family protein
MLTGDRLMFPYISHLLAAMLLGAIIGAERQWRQRMAGLRTNALVATGAAVFILSSVSTSPDSPGRIAAQIVSGIGFLGAGVIMREGMNIRGLIPPHAVVFGRNWRMWIRPVLECRYGQPNYSLR